VPLLSQRITAQQEPAAIPATPATRPPMLTVPLRVQIDDLALTMHRDVPNNVVAMPRAQPTVPMRAPTAPPAAPLVATMMMPPAPVPRMHSPSASPINSPQYPVLQSSASHSMLSSYTAAAYPVPQRKRSLLAIILVPACVVGVGIGLALAVNGSKRKAPVARAEPAEPAAPAVVALAPGPSEPPFVAVAAAPAPVVEPTVPTVPAVEPTVPTVPAAAAVPLSEPPRAAPLPGPSVMTPPPEPARPTLASLFKAGRFADAVAECNASPRTVAQNATTCTVAACKAHESSKAKRWFGTVPAAKRSAVVHDCGGVLAAEVQPPPVQQKKTPDNPCARDPLACQH
jgi:hypothetical protein